MGSLSRLLLQLFLLLYLFSRFLEFLLPLHFHYILGTQSPFHYQVLTFVLSTLYDTTSNIHCTLHIQISQHLLHKYYMGIFSFLFLFYLLSSVYPSWISCPLFAIFFFYFLCMYFLFSTLLT